MYHFVSVISRAVRLDHALLLCCRRLNRAFFHVAVKLRALWPLVIAVLLASTLPAMMHREICVEGH